MAVTNEIERRIKALQPETLPKNDISASFIFSEVFKNKHRFCQEARQWYVYDKGIWTLDAEGLSASRSLKALSKHLMKYASTVELPEENEKAFIKWCTKLFDANVRRKILMDARDQHFFSKAQLDAEPYLLCVENGVLDLRKIKEGKIRLISYDPNFLMSKKANVSYKENAKCPRFDRFMDEIMEGDQEKIKLLDEYHSLGLIGETLEDKVMIEYGPTTRNGKSTLDGVYYDLLGDYCLNIAPETLATQKPDSRRASGDIARLHGARFVMTSEPRHKLNLNSELLKKMSGKDTITARHLNEKEFEFRPTFNITMNTNYLPSINDATVFNSERILVVSFDRHFSPEEQDKNLHKELEKEKSGILNRLISALERYFNQGALTIPEAVKTSTQDYKEDSDTIQTFIDECLEPAGEDSRDKCVSVKSAYTEYGIWAKDNDIEPCQKKEFMEAMKSKMLWRKQGTINGKTVKNVIWGYSDFIRTTKTFDEAAKSAS